VFASFDTRALEASVKKGVDLAERELLEAADAAVGIGYPVENLRRRVKTTAAELSDIVTQTAETWSERERIGAMITLMEAGMEPRTAARMVIDGLYDYAGSMTKGDRHVLVNLMFPFWAFQKNANRMVLRTMFSPQGAYRMGVLRRGMDVSAEAITHLLYERVADPYGLDYDSMPPDLQDNYWFLRKAIEIGYGPLDKMSESPEGKMILSEIEAKFGPLAQMDPKTRDFLENGYGGIHRVPPDVKNALRMYFAGVGGSANADELGEITRRGQIVSFSTLLQNRALQLQPGTMQGDHEARFSDYYSPKPHPSARRGYLRDRVGFAITPRINEQVRRWMGMAENDPESGYKDAFIEVLFPDSTIHAGFRHATAMTAMMMLAGRGVAGLVVNEGADANVGDAMLRTSINLMGDPLGAPIPAEIIEAFALGGVEGGASPRRLHPGFARHLRTLKNMGVPLPTIVIVPAKEDKLAPPGEEIRELERAYISPGIGTLLFTTSPFGELNDLYIRWEQSPIEQRMKIEGEMLRWARVVIGAQVVETARTKSARGEAPRFMRTSTQPPQPK
jgi:hypothetical protein